MKRYLIAFFIITKFTCIDALELPIEFSVSSGKLEGHNTYQIGNKSLFPFSELKFPINSTVTNVELTIPEIHNYRFTALFSTTLKNDPNNVLVDKDWLSPGSLDILSEGKTEMNSFQFEVIGERYIHSNENVQLSLGIGYNFKHYNFVASDVKQWYPSGRVPNLNNFSPNTIHTAQGNYIEYNTNTHIPFAQLKGIMEVGNLEIEISGRYSPFAILQDYDNHLLRKKEMNSIGYGNHMGINTKIKFKFTSSFSLFASSKYSITTTSGIQTQRFYEDTLEADKGTTFEVNHKGFSEEFLIQIGLNYVL